MLGVLFFWLQFFLFCFWIAYCWTMNRFGSRWSGASYRREYFTLIFLLESLKLFFPHATDPTLTGIRLFELGFFVLTTVCFIDFFSTCAWLLFLLPYLFILKLLMQYLILLFGGIEYHLFFFSSLFPYFLLF